MTIRDMVFAQIHHEETDFIPYNLLFESPAQKKLDEYYGSHAWANEIRQAWHSSVGMFDSWDTLRPLDPNDPSKKIDAYGNRWTQTEAIAHLDQPGMYDPEIDDCDVEGYTWPTLDDFLSPDRRKKLEDCCMNHNPDEFFIVPLGAGHWELSWRLLGVENALMMCIAEPEQYEYIIEHLDKLLNQFAEEAVKLPCDAIMLFDDWCDQRGCTMGPDRWRKYFKPRFARIYKKIHDAGKITINHVCGNVSPLIPDLIEIGLDVLESVQPEPKGMNPYELKRKFGDKLAFCGGLGCQSTITFGTPDELRREIRKLRREMSVGGGYILQPTKDINGIPSTENLVAIYETFIEENYKLRQ